MTSSISAGHRALRRGRRSLARGCYLLTATTWQRRRVFDDFPLAASACRAFIAAVPEDASLLAWVLMPDHVHWLVQLGDVTPLARTVSRMKAASTRAVNEQRGVRDAVWTRAYHDRALRNDDDLRIAARYLIANPLRAGLVERVGAYPFWDAIWLP
ncbi:REP element-mobilizing transposase RayT [Xanthomonas arboricola]|uniref:REP-associated tyrosine transposase n=1 Tax=Xanthomonas sp. 3793 TaxID=3035312 RepID=UPI002168B523|nr:transposase [Xanthomonas sp. 3793]MCS3745869.1 REP element-mobilizing transposase RayT [Xanthomonas sp. 3793]